MTTPRSRSDAETVYRALKNDITHFVFKPGERLIEMKLSERYNVSRTPVREALRRLTEEGLVNSTDGGGCSVPPFDPVEYEDLFVMRVALEDVAVTQACARATSEEIAELRESWDHGFRSPDPALDGSYVEANERFHLGISHLARNHMLSTILRRIHERVRIVTIVDFTSIERIRCTEKEHNAILDAIAKREQAQARRLMQEHISASRDNIEDLLRRAVGRIYLGEPRG